VPQVRDLRRTRPFEAVSRLTPESRRSQVRVRSSLPALFQLENQARSVLRACNKTLTGCEPLLFVASFE
jgi:hypothetical protein